MGGWTQESWGAQGWGSTGGSWGCLGTWAGVGDKGTWDGAGAAEEHGLELGTKGHGLELRTKGQGDIGWSQGHRMELRLLGMRSCRMTWGCRGQGDRDPWLRPIPEPSPCPQMNFIAAAFHDGVLLYAQALNETLEQGGSITNASAITRQMWNRTFYGEPCPHPIPIPAGCCLPGTHLPRSQDDILGSKSLPMGWGLSPAPHPPSPGVTGFLKIDENGDRESDYSLWDMDPVQGDFQVSPSMGADGPVRWPGASSHPFLPPPQDRGQLQRHHQEDPDGARA